MRTLSSSEIKDYGSKRVTIVALKHPKSQMIPGKEYTVGIDLAYVLIAQKKAKLPGTEEEKPKKKAAPKKKPAAKDKEA